jgi:hypothetical protein
MSVIEIAAIRKIMNRPALTPAGDKRLLNAEKLNRISMGVKYLPCTPTMS